MTTEMLLLASQTGNGKEAIPLDASDSDDCLCAHHGAMSALNELDHYFKEEKRRQSGTQTCAWAKSSALPNGIEAWGIGPSKYVQEAVKNVEGYL